MTYSVSNSEAIGKAVKAIREVNLICEQQPAPWLPGTVHRVAKNGVLLADAVDELQAKVDEQAAYIEQVEASYSQMMRSLDEVHAEVKGT